MTLNGKAVTATTKESVLLFGRRTTVLESRLEEPLPEISMTVKTIPAVVRAAVHDGRIVTFTLDNTLDEPVSGSLQFDLPTGISVVPEKAMFGPVQPRASAKVGVIIVSNKPRTTHGARSRLLPGRIQQQGDPHCGAAADGDDGPNVAECL